MTVYRQATLSGAGFDLVFTNRELVGDRSESWLQDLTGFFGGVGVDAEKTQRSLGHGLFSAVSRRTGRALTLKAYLHFEDERDRTLADRLVSGVLWDGEPGTLTVDTGGLILSCSVQLDGEVSHAYHGTHGVDLSIPLSAADPFLYAPVETVQVYPAGSGVGLRFPLFGGAWTNTASLVSGLTAGDKTPGGLSSARFSSNVPASTQIVNMASVTPGKTYSLTTWAKADRTGSNFAVRYVLTGPGKTDQAGYIMSPTTRNVTTAWTSYSLNVKVPDGYTGVSLSVYPNHYSGTVTNAVVDVAVSVGRFESGPLSFGKANPNTRAVIQNMGNATEYPTIRVCGDLPSGFTLRDSSGRTITYPAPVWSQSPVEVDSKLGAVFQGGQDQTYRATRRDWFSIEAGGVNSFTITAPQNGDGYAEIQHRSTYI